MSTASTIARYYGLMIEDEPPLLEWDDWPIRDDWRVAVLLVLGLCLTSLAVFWVTGRFLWTVVADLLVAGSFGRWLLKATYRMGPYGVERIVFGRLQRIPWRAIRSVRIENTGVFLFDTAHPCVADVLRAVFVPFGPNRDAVLARLEYYLAQGMQGAESLSQPPMPLVFPATQA